MRALLVTFAFLAGWQTASYSPAMPKGMIVVSLNAGCGNGWTEATELNGKVLVGTLQSNGNVGTTRGINQATIPGSDYIRVIFCKAK